MEVRDTDLSAVIAPLNVCKPPAVPASGWCYGSPNRVQVMLAYMADGQLHTDLASRADGAAPNVDEQSGYKAGLNKAVTIKR